MSVDHSNYEIKRWKIWKFAAGGTALGVLSYLINFKSETAFYRSMHFNNAEIFLQGLGYILSATLIALVIVAIQNVWVWHSSRKHGLGQPHVFLAAVLITFGLLNLATLDPYALL